MKEYRISKVHGGDSLSLHYIVVCKTKKRAAELFNVTTGFMNGYGNTLEPRTADAIANPEKIYAYADSGLIFQHRRDLLNKIVPKEELHAAIDAINKERYKL